MPRGSPELVGAKLSYVKELVTADKSLLMYAVAKKVQKKFNESLAPDKLRAAFLESGGTIMRRGAKRKVNGQRSASEKPQGAPKPDKRKPGRREADKVAARSVRALDELEKHVVVVRSGDVPEVHEFASQDRAKSFLSGKLSDGVSASALGYYVREPLLLTIGI
ncbi:MAG: hypothetical protein KBG84_00310 [Planctomycetes bacterium]|nr:hypothetical protein [Planctomycetota bacterium]